MKSGAIYKLSMPLNNLYILLHKCPNAPWDWNHISNNPNLTVYMLNKYKDLLNWQIVSHNEIVTWRVVKDNLHLPWNWEYLTYNRNISESIIFEHSYLPWRFSTVKLNHPIIQHICINKITPFQEYYKTLHYYSDNVWDIIKLFPNIPWFLEGLSNNKNLDFDVIFTFHKWDWEWSEIFDNNNFSIDVLEKHKDIIIEICKGNDDVGTYDLSNLSRNVSFSYLLENLDLSWNWYFLTMNLSIPLDKIFESPTLPWDWENIVDRKDITIEFVVSHMTISWCWTTLSYYFRHTKEIEYPHLPWENVRPRELERARGWYVTMTREPIEFYEKHTVTARELLASDKAINYTRVSLNWFQKNLEYLRKKYFDMFRQIVVRHKHERKNNKVLYESVLDMYKLRLRDIEAGIRKSII